MSNYYAKGLSGRRLMEVYNTAIPQAKDYLEGEIRFVRDRLRGGEKILEVAAGYGRIMKELAPFAGGLVGLDISEENISFGREYLQDAPNCSLVLMDAHSMNYREEFDMVLCLQNGLSSVKGQPFNIVKRSLDALLPGGRAFFSTYSDLFWEWRVAWFQEQAEKCLLGELDMEKCGGGKIVCKDGFTAVTFTVGDLEALGKRTGQPYRIETAANSSLFLIVEKS